MIGARSGSIARVPQPAAYLLASLLMFAGAWYGFNALKVWDWWHDHLGENIFTPTGRTATFANWWAIWGGRLLGVVLLCVGVVFAAMGVTGLLG
jgi:hypothetical protein